MELKPETERLVKEELQLGHFHSVDELIVQGVNAWREKQHAALPEARPRKTLHELLTQPPFAGSELIIERQKEYPRQIDVE